MQRGSVHSVKCVYMLRKIYVHGASHLLVGLGFLVIIIIIIIIVIIIIIAIVIIIIIITFCNY